ncbi:hypothetical protein TcasGA2_TC005839 [Tribolium castaneum]|uniref:Uncharacterized protein n=1 Tax=Tribolium castaneum TaxID=7070 RepID=D6WVZ8_TRICA|nr:hypothetical protein TcasGA2_TC005839 [Tribolium castaneum]
MSSDSGRPEPKNHLLLNSPSVFVTDELLQHLYLQHFEDARHIVTTTSFQHAFSFTKLKKLALYKQQTAHNSPQPTTVLLPPAIPSCYNTKTIDHDKTIFLTSALSLRHPAPLPRAKETQRKQCIDTH